MGHPSPEEAFAANNDSIIVVDKVEKQYQIGIPAAVIETLHRVVVEVAGIHGWSNGRDIPSRVNITVTHEYASLNGKPINESTFVLSLIPDEVDNLIAALTTAKQGLKW